MTSLINTKYESSYTGELIYLFDKNVPNIFIYQQMLQTESRTSYNHPSIQKIIEIDDPQVEEQVKNRIKEKLLQDAEILIDRKKKQQEKKERIKKIQESLEKKREDKLRLILQKKNKSDQVIEKNKDDHNKKIKQQQDYFQQILSKNYRKQQEDIINAISKQKQLQSSGSRTLLNKSKNNRANTIQDGAFMNSRYVNSFQFERLSEEIEKKAQKAQKNHQIHNKQIVQRLREKSENISSAKQKALAYERNQQMQSIKNWGKKVGNIQLAHQSLKLDREKRLIERRRSFKNKIDKCSENLKNLSYREQEKYDELQTKFNRKLQPKEWKDPRQQKYWKLWEENSEKIKEQKDEDATKILLKHQQITEQNRVYKSRKEKLIQAMKFL